MNAIDEYTNVNDHPNGNGRHNGNGNGKGVFGLHPVPDPLISQTAPRLRTEARHSPTIGAGAKVLFDELTDLSFLRSVSPQPGVVKMSKKVLAQSLHLNERTITRQARELENARFVWTRIVWECGFEITLWYIRGMADPQTELFHRPNPSYGSSRGLRARPVHRGNRGRFAKATEPPAPPTGGPGGPAPEPPPAPPAPPSDQKCPLDGPTVKTADLPQLSADHGQKCPRSPDKNVPGHRTKMSPVTGQKCPEPTVKNVRWPGTNSSRDTGQICPEPADTDDRRHRTEMSEFKETPDPLEQGEGSNTVNRVIAPSGRKSPSRPPEDTHDRSYYSENDFLQLCREVMGRWEIDDKPAGKKGNGGLWRTNFRNDKDRAWRVMREAESKKREGFKPDTTWPQYSMDLWIESRV